MHLKVVIYQCRVYCARSSCKKVQQALSKLTDGRSAQLGSNDTAKANQGCF